MSLHLYAKNGDLVAVERLLAKGAQVDDMDKEGLTPLMRATQSPRAGVDMLRLLIDHGANVNAVENPPPPPYSRSDLLDTLPEEVRKDLQLPGFSASAFSEAVNSQHPVLYFAVRAGDPEKVRYLLDRGADLYYLRPGGYDVLIDAMYTGNQVNLTLFTELLQRGAKVNGVSSYGESALKVASRLGRFDIVKHLLDAGADLEQLGWSPLMHAVLFGRTEDVFGLLLKRAYNAEGDHLGRTAFLLAVQAGFPDKAGFLLDAGADLKERDHFGQTALMYAVTQEKTALCRWLLDRGASIDAVDESGNSALIYAIQAGAQEHIRILLDAGANLFLKNNYGKNGLMTVRDPAIIPLLIEYGGDWADTNDELRRALAGLPDNYEPEISQERYRSGKNRRFGRHNPEVMNMPFWKEMIRSGVSAGQVRMQFIKNWVQSGFEEAIWCYNRFGKSMNVLPDGRIIEIGGEHEDYYDPDFCIYNEVVVFTGKGDFTIYGYPKLVFPPTDFHSATLVDNYLYIIGGLGYQHERYFGETPVYRLDVTSFSMQQIKTTGDKPGWIFEHQASFAGHHQIKIWGGKICTVSHGKEQTGNNLDEFRLDLGTRKWVKS